MDTTRHWDFCCSDQGSCGKNGLVPFTESIMMKADRCNALKFLGRSLFLCSLVIVRRINNLVVGLKAIEVLCGGWGSSSVPCTWIDTIVI